MENSKQKKTLLFKFDLNISYKNISLKTRIPAAKKIAQTYERLQIGKMQTEDYIDLLLANGMSTRGKFTELVKDQMSKVGIVLDNIIQSSIESKEIILEAIMEEMRRFTQPQSHNDHIDVLQLLEFKDGEPFISPSAIAKIEESESVYAVSEKGHEALRLQKRALAAISDYVQFIRPKSEEGPFRAWRPVVDGNIFFTNSTGEVEALDVDFERIVQ